MKHRRHLLRTLAVVALTTAVAGPSAATPAVDVVRVSAETPAPLSGCRPDDDAPWALFDGNDGRSVETDPSVAVNPLDPELVVVAWPADRAAGMVAAASFDGGDTWTRTVVPGMTTCTGGTERHVLHARLSFGPDGRVYLAGETLDGFFPDPRSGIIRIPVSTSTDGGLTWSQPSIVADGVGNGFDRITAEPDLPGAAVVAWHGPEGAAQSFLSRTTDGGRTWTTRTLPLPSPEMQPIQGVHAAPDGRLYVFAADQTAQATAALLARTPFDLVGAESPVTFASNLTVIRSDDKGATWTSPTTVVPGTVAEWVTAAATPDGTLVVSTWRAAETGRELLVARSYDHGATWSAPDVVATDVAGPYPGLAAGADGRVGVVYAAADGDRWRQVVATSDDEGRTWARHPVGSPYGGGAFGMYQETAATADGFVSAFVRGGDDTVGPTDVFLARVA